MNSLPMIFGASELNYIFYIKFDNNVINSCAFLKKLTILAAGEGEGVYLSIRIIFYWLDNLLYLNNFYVYLEIRITNFKILYADIKKIARQISQLMSHKLFVCLWICPVFLCLSLSMMEYKNWYSNIPYRHFTQRRQYLYVRKA